MSYFHVKTKIKSRSTLIYSLKIKEMSVGKQWSQLNSVKWLIKALYTVLAI